MIGLPSRDIVEQLRKSYPLFVNWDCGSGLGVVYGEDHIRKI